MKDWTGKVVIVTGSSAGIGRETAKLFASLGAKIVLNGRNESKLEALGEEFRGNGWPCISICGDIGEQEFCRLLIDKTIQTWGRIDVLVNNAGLSMRGRFEELSHEVDEKVWRVNYFGSSILTRFAYPYLQQAAGSVVFVSSFAAFRGLPVMSSYCSAKMALTALAESLHVESKSTGVHTGIIYLGYTSNDADKTILDNSGKVVPLVNLDQYKKHDQKYIAKMILKNVEKRKFKSVSSFIGRLHLLSNFLIPRLMDRFFLSLSSRLDSMRKSNDIAKANELTRQRKVIHTPFTHK